MGISKTWENLTGSLNKTFVYDESGSKKSGQLGLINTNATLDVPIDIDARTTNTTNTYSPTFTDSRQISIIRDSPNATMTTKKEDSVSGSTNPNTQTGSTVPVTVPINLDLPKIPSVGNFILIGGAVIGGVILLKSVGGKK